MIAADLIRRGYKIAIPYGEDWDFDLIVCRDERLERVQCKYTCSDGIVVYARASSQSLTKGKVKTIKRYTASTIDWLAVYDATTDPLLLRSRIGTRGRYEAAEPSTAAHAKLPASPGAARKQLPLDLMEPAGFEPAASSVQATRSTN